ncbi:hypothetical protein J7L48_11575, partial [bacterium]|nr:hypothetical protein [bacterium]
MLEKILGKKQLFNDFFKIFVKKKPLSKISSSSSFLNVILSYLSHKRTGIKTFFITYSPIS